MVDRLVANTTRSLRDLVVLWFVNVGLSETRSLGCATDARDHWERLRARTVVRVRDALVDRSHNWRVGDDDDDDGRDGYDSVCSAVTWWLQKVKWRCREMCEQRTKG